jgi:hypothetical protein
MKRARLEKRPIDPERLRRLPPEGFSWIDRRFVRDAFLAALPRDAILLYFFLVAVADAEGLSFYSDSTISRLLELDPEELSRARARLSDADLIRYRQPLYQVLSLPVAPRHPSPPSRSPQPPRGGEAMSIREFFATLERERHRGDAPSSRER